MFIVLVKSQTNFLDNPGQHPRELNPFWRDGGAGLPSAEVDTESNRSSESTRSEERPTSSSKHRSLGDGGHSWLLRAYKRAIEQTKDTGRSLEDIATERWGSLEKLYSLLSAAGIDPENPDAPPKGRGRRDYLYSRTRRIDEDRERRSVDEFDRRRDRGRRERGGEMDRHLAESGDRRKGDFDRDRGRAGEGRREMLSTRKEYKRKEGDVEKRKRDWKKGFRKPRSPDSRGSDDSSGFLKPGDLVRSGTSSAIGAFPGTQTNLAQGWRKKKRVPVTDIPDKPEEKAKDSELDQTSAPFHSEVHSEPPTAVSQEDSVDERSGRTLEVAVPAEPVTEAQLNSLGAKLMKAELVGNSDKVEKLKKELDRLREVKRLQKNASNQLSGVDRAPNVEREERTLVLMKTDRFGREKPLQLPSSSLGYQPQSKAPTHTKKGKREKYFHDDDRYSLKELVEQERMMTAEETHAAIARMASKFVPAAGADETVDDVVESKTAMRYNEAKELDRARKRAVTENRKMADVVEKCQFCFDNQNFSKHLLVAVGMNTYLCAPWHTSLTDGHCYIVPMEHVTCSMYLDENVWSEVEIFRKGLTQMFADRGLDVVFMETYTSVKRKTHMYIDCIPLPREEGELVPMYFKKAILESDEEWAQNKKLIDTKEKGVRGSLPTGLPYFFAEFGLDGGFGHVIEDTDKFPHYFGREVIGGLLDLNPRLWLKSRREDFEKQKAKVVKLSEWWSPYDWTQKLQQTE